MDSEVCVTEDLYLLETIRLLTQTIKDKDTIIADKDELITLLKEKISYLESTPSKSNDNKSNTTYKKPSSTKNDKEQQIHTPENKTTKNPIRRIDKKAESSDHQKLQDKQVSVMSHLININSDEKEIPTGGSNSSQPKYGVDKKNRNTQIGEAKLSEEDEKMVLW
ncbi:hypothetical protein JTB14_019878 [Gonioctena quinquepunctata]|nr:hypothetical protein JTB14_019878 [Gonioctena quinquepunctata]